tara:strand:- start:261 stop:557 length:297 start_codon:yes stop_codon:yes gene_type:complete
MSATAEDWIKLRNEHPAIEKQVDVVNHPSHYANASVECIDAIEASMTGEQMAGYLRGNVQKYVFRAYSKHPTPLVDLKKAQWYLNRLIETEEQRFKEV